MTNTGYDVNIISTTKQDFIYISSCLKKIALKMNGHKFCSKSGYLCKGMLPGICFHMYVMDKKNTKLCQIMLIHLEASEFLK